MIDILEERTESGGYRHLVLAGAPRLLSQVRDALPERLRGFLIDQLPASDRTSVEDVVTATLSTFVEEEQRESLSVVDTLFDALYRDGLAVVGARRCLAALEHDQADLVIMAHDYDARSREPILRAAQRSGCTVEFVDGNDRLERVGGVGCLLRYRLPDATLDPLEFRSAEGSG
jgi:ribosomal protein L7Ae-like RNA K-turn-binding protein